MNYFKEVFKNFKNIFWNHRELLFNLINFQIFLRLFWFFTLLWVAALFKRSFLEESDFSLNYEALQLLFSTEVIFFGILYVFLFFFFVLLEKIWLNLILFQNENNPKFLLKNIYTELLKNLRKIVYLFFLEFAIVSFIIAMFVYFSLFIYISVGLGVMKKIYLKLLVSRSEESIKRKRYLILVSTMLSLSDEFYYLISWSLLSFSYSDDLFSWV